MRLLLSAVLACSFVWVGCSPSGAPARRRDGAIDPGSDAGTTPLVDTGAPFVPTDTGPRPDTGPPPPGDRDADGLPDADEATRGTNPDDEDSDDDGVSDGVEVLAGTDPTDAASTIPPTDFYVVLPFEDPEIHRELSFRARLGRADIFFLVDTTGSMGAVITNVRTSLSGTIVPGIQDAIVDAVMGVGDFRDFPTSPYGDGGDWAIQIRQPVTDDIPAVQRALDALRAGGGGDLPEASTEGLYAAVAGTCASGTGFGGACFRSESHPIIVHVTDAAFHNGPVAANDYSGVAGAHTWSETIAALNAHDVNVCGVSVSSLGGSGARSDLNELCVRTDSYNLSDHVTNYTAASGTVSRSVVNGIVDLIETATQDVSARPLDDTADTVDATRFMRAITPLRATRSTSHDATTFYDVAGGTEVTFDVTFVNDFQRETSRVQIFRAFIEVFDVDSSTALDRRNVYVVVPAEGGVLI